jgi:HEAT repeat protein
VPRIPGITASPLVPGNTAAVGRPTGVTPSRNPGRKSSSSSYDRWEFWWHLNSAPYLFGPRDAREDLLTVDSGWYLGKADRDNIAVTTIPTPTFVMDRILPVLREALRDPFFDIRAAAVIAMGKSGEKREIPLILDVLRDDHRQVRESAVLALGILGEPSVVPALTAIMNDSAEGRRLTRRSEILTRTRAFAAAALGLVGRSGREGSESAMMPLLDAATRSEPALDVPVCAIDALGVLGSRDAVPRLVDLARDPRQDKTLRAHAILALGRIGDPAALPLVQSATRDREVFVKRSAILALGLLGHRGDDTTLSTLTAEIVRGQDQQARSWALVALGKCGDATSREVLLRSLANETGLSKPFAAIGLALLVRRTGNVTDARYIHQAFLESHDTSTRAGLAIALGLAGYEKAGSDLLETAASKGSPELRGYCTVALGLLGARDTIPTIQRLLEEQRDPEFRRSAATALGLLGDKGAVKTLEGMLRAASTEYEMSSVALALGAIRDVAAVQPLLSAFRDKDGTADLARANAVTALGLLASENRLPPLWVYTTDSNYRSMVSALDELFSIL